MPAIGSAASVEESCHVDSIGGTFSTIADINAVIAAANLRDAQIRVALTGVMSGINPGGGTQNCARCAIAMDLRLRGRDSRCIPSPAATSMAPVLAAYGASSSAMPRLDGVNALLLGLRLSFTRTAIVFAGRWQRDEQGMPVQPKWEHAFNAIVIDGQPYFADPQIGAVYDLPQMMARWDAFSFLRTDDKIPQIAASGVTLLQPEESDAWWRQRLALLAAGANPGL